MNKFLTAFLVLLLTSVFGPLPEAQAAGMLGFGGCGTQCMAMMGGAFQPFYGTPWLQDPYAGYGMTGEMSVYENASPVDPTLMALSYQMNWPGSQPLGMGSYMPPIGGAALYNRQNHKGLQGYFEAMSGY